MRESTAERQRLLGGNPEEHAVARNGHGALPLWKGACMAAVLDLYGWCS